MESDKNWHDIVVFALNTGLRKGEIFNLNFSNINMNERIIFIIDSKSNKNRIIPMNDPVYDILCKKINKSNINENIFYGKNKRSFINAVNKAGLNNGITDRRQKVVFHTLRHTFASWLVQDGVPLAVVSKLLGHSTINLTMRYTHLAPTQYRQAVNLLTMHLKA